MTGDRLETLYDEFGDGLYHYLLGRVRDVAAAEDLLQTVMLRVVRHRGKLRRVENLRAWLYTVARNETRRFLARRGRRGGEPVGDAVDLFVAPDSGARDEDSEALRVAVRRLSPERYEVVSLKVWQGLTFGEIGAVLAISPNTAASRYRYALEDLGRMLRRADEQRTG